MKTHSKVPFVLWGLAASAFFGAVVGFGAGAGSRVEPPPRAAFEPEPLLERLRSEEFRRDLSAGAETLATIFSVVAEATRPAPAPDAASVASQADAAPARVELPAFLRALRERLATEPPEVSSAVEAAITTLLSDLQLLRISPDREWLERRVDLAILWERSAHRLGKSLDAAALRATIDEWLSAADEAPGD